MINGSVLCVQTILGHCLTSETKPQYIIYFKRNSRGTCVAGFVGNPKNSLV